MLTRWTDFDRSVMAMDDFRRRMDRLFDEFDDGRSVGYARQTGSYPRANLWGVGENLVLVAEVPGLSENELDLSIHQDVLTLTGEGRVKAPDGYSVHRQERASIRFSRSFTLPVPVDMERVKATVKDGMLTVTMAKAPEARPRQITIRSE
jgi:HSP20 family protein